MKRLVCLVSGLLMVMPGCSSDDEGSSPAVPDAGTDAVVSSDAGGTSDVAIATDTGSTQSDTTTGISDVAGADTQEPTPDTPTGDTPADVHRALLASLADQVIIKTYNDFVDATEALVTATAAYAASPEASGQEEARAAYHAAMDIWQRAEVLQVGPAGSMTSALGGQALRDEIYSWPSVNSCRVDQEVVEQAYTDAAVFGEELTNVRGLDALEYLLFPPESGNGCKASSSINKNGSWDEVVQSGELEARRATYAATLATLLAGEAKDLRDLWTQGAAQFSDELGNAGDGSETYPTAQDGLNAVSDAMFYVEKITKDMKLAMPAGVSGCEEDTCPDDLESQHGKRSAQNVEQNLIALQALFLGSYDGAAQAPGFDELLMDIGAEALAQDMTDKIAAAIEVAANVSGTYAELLASDAQKVVDVHAAVKAFTDLLKTEFVSTLDLALPKSAAGDND